MSDVDFTSGETKLLISILKNLEGDLKSDFSAVAAECGLKDASIAKTRWGQIRRKKIQPGGSSATGAGVKKTPSPTKKAATAGGSAKGKKAKSKVVVDSDDESDEDEGGEYGGGVAKGKGKVVKKEKSVKKEKVKEEAIDSEDNDEGQAVVDEE